MRHIGTIPILLLALAGLCTTGAAQSVPSASPLTLQDAVLLALRQAPEHRAAALDVDAARTSQRMEKTALLPTFSFAEQATRGNDPVYVFGTRLRQQRFSQSNFALNQLNRPTPLGNFATRFSGNWTLFDSWKTEFAMRRAAMETESMQSAATRADQQIVHRVAICYEGVRTAAKQLEVARHQVETAKALLVSSKTRVSAGLAVDSDELSAAANLAARQQEEIAAEGDLQIAWAELEQAAGTPIPASQRNIPALETAHFEPPALDSAIVTALHTRPDQQSLQQNVEAGHTGVQEAKSAFAPTLHAFGDWEADRGSFAGSGGSNWMAGAELSIDLFPAAKRQQLSLARISAERARVTAQSGENQIRLEVTRAWYAQQAAARMVEVAQASLAQTDESLRILRNRYNAGLATITDLLRAEDVQRQASANYWNAVSRNATAWADLTFAMGTLNADHLGNLQ
ncbi:MAG TPA: TolC family protein [Terracidiphilus sp.]|nr:TolC family protein [Terracidiphilus sp.]